jgi:hypothetical protein
MKKAKYRLSRTLLLGAALFIWLGLAVPGYAAADQGQVQTFTGYIIDEDCFVKPAYADPAQESKGCLTMPGCAASGYGLAVRQADGTWKFNFFDGNTSALKKSDVAGMSKDQNDATGGQKLAWDFINAHIAGNNIPVTVKGVLTGDTRINPLPDSDGISYPVIRVDRIEPAVEPNPHTGESSGVVPLGPLLLALLTVGLIAGKVFRRRSPQMRSKQVG